MTIEFDCPTCGELLSTPDETAGQYAACPACDASIRIPEQSAYLEADGSGVNTTHSQSTFANDHADDFRPEVDVPLEPEPAADSQPRRQASRIKLVQADRAIPSKGDFWATMTGLPAAADTQADSELPPESEAERERRADAALSDNLHPGDLETSREPFPYELVPVSHRVLAFGLDIISILVLASTLRFLLFFAVFAVWNVNLLLWKWQDVAILLGALGGVGGLLYLTTCEASRLQGSFGKIALDMAVINKDGGRLTFGQSLTRQLMKIVSLATFGLGILIAVFDRTGRALHDRVVGSHVVKRK